MANDARDRAFLLVSGFRSTQMVRAVTELKIPDLVAGEARSSDDLAMSTGVLAEPLRRVLRCLVALGVFTETEDGRFGSTAVSDQFRDRPGSVRGQALMLPSESYRAFDDLMHSLKTGEVAFEHVFGMSHWEQLALVPDRAAIFNTAMQFGTEAVRDAVTAAYDCGGVGSIVDVGGGRGTLAAGFLKANPAMRGTVYDLEAGLAETEAYLKKEGVGDRCQLVVGNFFESVPAGHDLYVLKHIIHDWEDAKASMILASCRKAMGPRARLIVVEQIVPARVQDSLDAHLLFMADIQMLVMMGGRERTEDEYKSLLQGAGLRLTRIIPTDSRLSVIEVVPA